MRAEDNHKVMAMNEQVRRLTLPQQDRARSFAEALATLPTVNA